MAIDRRHRRGRAWLTRNPTRVLVRDGAGQVVQDQDLGRGQASGALPGEQQLGCGGRGAPLRFAIARTRFARSGLNDGLCGA
jgi:hypothetical protein